jgi:hypothetical protein
MSTVRVDMGSIQNFTQVSPYAPSLRASFDEHTEHVIFLRTATVRDYTHLVYSGTNSPVDKTEQKLLLVTVLVTPWHERCSLQLSPHGVTVTKSDFVSEIHHATFVPGPTRLYVPLPFFSSLTDARVSTRTSSLPCRRFRNMCGSSAYLSSSLGFLIGRGAP